MKNVNVFGGSGFIGGRFCDIYKDSVIVQNRDDNVTTIYDYGSIIDPIEKSKFLELGELWWWESNRLIPINLFLKDDWSIFKPYIRTFTNKTLLILHGPACSLTELHKRRSKRRSITLVKRLP